MNNVFRQSGRRLVAFAGWFACAVAIGIICGLTGCAFSWCVTNATGFRTAHSWMVFLLPLSGLIIVYMYRRSGEYKTRGTNLVLASINESEHIPFRQAPLIFISTVITHLFGGSSGREGAALQLGGSIAQKIGRVLHMNDEDVRTITMCGMSACFSAVFGTPLAAAIFSMEVISVGIMHYAAIVPCVVSSFTASLVARQLGFVSEVYVLPEIPVFAPGTAIITVLLAIIFALASILFCRVLYGSEVIFSHIRNPYLRVMLGGALVAALSVLLGTQDYLGTSIPLLASCFTGAAIPLYAFALKLLFTALTLSSGFKGGEIVPSFVVGGTLGAALAGLFGLPTGLFAACGVIGLFCGVTNCPITSLLIAFELFGFKGMPYFAITIAVSYMLSDYYGLYSTQRILYSKFSDRRINEKTKK